MSAAPNPAQLAAQVKAAAQRQQERERADAARKKRATRISSHIDEETLGALQTIARTDRRRKGKKR